LMDGSAAVGFDNPTLAHKCREGAIHPIIARSPKGDAAIQGQSAPPAPQRWTAQAAGVGVLDSWIATSLRSSR
ncbi:hypothetical protein, partial [Roseiarcus fermentans]|uniref:hypothetical protein n=1 Tax=Roseiarcus fermentans TaxID=1473586 RepID=UPI001AECD15F